MDNIITDLRINISALEIENAALRRKIDQMYKDWLYDTNKYTELKELVKQLRLKPSNAPSIIASTYPYG
jgi:malate synthase